MCGCRPFAVGDMFKFWWQAAALTGCTILSSLMVPIDESTIGVVGALQLFQLAQKRFLHLPPASSRSCSVVAAPVSTLALCAVDEFGLEELEVAVTAAINALNSLLRTPLIVAGGGCFEMFCAAFLRRCFETSDGIAAVDLWPNERLWLCGLHSRPEFNGAEALFVAPLPNGRARVRLQHGEASVLSVAAANVRRLDPRAAAGVRQMRAAVIDFAASLESVIGALEPELPLDATLSSLLSANHTELRFASDDAGGEHWLYGWDTASQSAKAVLRWRAEGQNSSCVIETSLAESMSCKMGAMRTAVEIANSLMKISSVIEDVR